ncbi:MAG: hypothetical protein WAM28_01410 [Chlamydiales bacterium]
MSIANQYSRNVIINIGGDGYQIEALKGRIQSKPHGKEVPIHVIDLKDRKDFSCLSEEDLGILSQVDHLSRVYILDHGSRGSGVMNETHFSTLSSWLSKGLTHHTLQLIDAERGIVKEQENGRTLRISLLSCHGGLEGEEGESSFASRLHYELGKAHNINTQLIARRRYSYTGYFAKKHGKLTSEVYKPLMSDFEGIDLNLLHKAPGSKVTIGWGGRGNQMVVDSYIESSARKVLFALEKLQEMDAQKTPERTKAVERLKSMVEDIQHLNHSTLSELIFLVDCVLNTFRKDPDPEIHHVLEYLKKDADDFDSVISHESIFADQTGKKLSDYYENIDEWIVRTIHKPLQDRLREMIKDEARKDKPVKKTSQELLRKVSECSKARAVNDESIQCEQKMIDVMSDMIVALNREVFVEDCLQHLNTFREGFEDIRLAEWLAWAKGTDFTMEFQAVQRLSESKKKREEARMVNWFSEQEDDDDIRIWAKKWNDIFELFDIFFDSATAYARETKLQNSGQSQKTPNLFQKVKQTFNDLPSLVIASISPLSPGYRFS